MSQTLERIPPILVILDELTNNVVRVVFMLKFRLDSVHVGKFLDDIVGVVVVVESRLNKVISFDHIVSVSPVIRKLQKLMVSLAIAVLTFVVAVVDLRVVALVVLVEESFVIPRRRQLGIMQLLVIVADSLDVLGRIRHIRIIRRHVVLRMVTKYEVILLLVFFVSHMPPLVVAVTLVRLQECLGDGDAGEVAGRDVSEKSHYGEA